MSKSKKYDEEIKLKSGLIIVIKDGKCMLIDEIRKPVSPWFESYEAGENFVLMKAGLASMLYNAKGEPIGKFEEWRDGKKVDVHTETIINKDGTIGVLSQTGVCNLPKECDNFETISEGLILGISSSEPTYSSVFAVNRHTEEVLGKTHIDSYFSDGLLPIKKGTKWGCINNNGEIAIPFQFDVIECFNNGVAIAKKDGKYGLIDTSGKELTGFIYDKLEGFTGEFKDYFKATINNKKGLINAVGETIVEFEFDDFIPYVFDDMMRSQNDGMMRVHKDGKEGLIDKDGNFVLECKYTAIRFISNELLVLSESQKVGVFDKHLNEIVPCEYDFIAHTCAKDGFVVALKDGLWGFLDISGNTFVPYKNTNNYYYERSLRIAAYGFENALNVLEDDFWNDFPAKFNTLEDVDSLIDLINAMIFKRMRESKKEGQKIEELYAKVMSNAIAKRIEIINNQFGIKKNPLVRAQQDFENLVKPTGSLVDPK